MQETNNHLLEVKSLTVDIPTERGNVRAVNDVSFHVDKQECYGLIGESGCGKSMTTMAVLRYTDNMGAIIRSGEISFNGEDILKYSKKQLREYRGGKAAIILQDPMIALNPVYTVKSQIMETIRIHQRLNRRECYEQMRETLSYLSIPEEKLNCYPFQLSGGILQRVVGAIAISCRPQLIIADEPTTALDVTVQLQYLKLLKRIQQKLGTAFVLISHDIRVVAMMCQRIGVMYGGKIVEEAPAMELFQNPLHPYTQALLKTALLDSESKDKMPYIDGQPPELIDPPARCLFAERCPYCTQQCMQKEPVRSEHSSGHYVCCWRVK